MSYRNQCSRCSELELEVEKLKAELLRKKQPPGMQPCPVTFGFDPDSPSSSHTVRCPFCTTYLGGEFLKPWFTDVNTLRITAICIGGKWRCKETVPHRHRECSNCGKRWTEHARLEEMP